MSSAGSPRQARRRSRVVAVSLVATASLVGTYLGALRPQSTYAATGRGAVETRNGSAPPLSGCEDVSGAKTYVDDDTKLQAAVTSSSDGDIICITGTLGFRLSKTLVLDDTSITLMGDDSSITLLPAAGPGSTSLRHLDANFTSVTAQLTIHSLTFRGDDTVTGTGGALQVTGLGDLDVYDSMFINNVASSHGGAIDSSIWTEVHDSVFTGNASDGNGGAIHKSGDDLRIFDTRFTINTATGEGGAIFSNQDVKVRDSEFNGNVAGEDGGGVYSHQSAELYIYGTRFTGNGAADGGAVYAKDDLYVYDSYFSGNVARVAGGAIYQWSRDLRVHRSQFVSNRAGNGNDGGGAIYADGDVYVYGSHFADNESDSGGAVFMSGGDDLLVDSSTFQSNRAVGSGSFGFGGAVFSGSLVTVTNSTFLANSSVNTGAAIYTWTADSGLYLNFVTSVDDSSGNGEIFAADDTFTLRGSVIAPAVGGGLACATSADDSSLDSFVTDISCGSGDDTVNTAFSTLASLGLDDTITLDDSTGARVIIPDDASPLINSAPADLVLGITTDQLQATRGRAPTNRTTSGAVQVLPMLITRDPEDTTVSAGGTAVFSASVEPGVGTQVAYQWETSRDGGANWTPLAGQTNDSLSLSGIGYSDDGLMVRVVAENVADATLASTSAVLSVPGPPANVPPGPPGGVTGVADDGRATITWSAPSSSGSFPVSTYQAVVSPGGQSCLVSSSPCTITGLTNGIEYTVRVRALSGAGWGAFSGPSAPFTPEAAPVEKTMVITGSRGEVRGRPGVIISGSSTGMVGEQVAPWVKFPGQTGYTQGSARRTISAEGDFTWQRRTGKKIYVYFRSVDSDVRSNRVIIGSR